MKQRKLQETICGEDERAKAKDEKQMTKFKDKLKDIKTKIKNLANEYKKRGENKLSEISNIFVTFKHIEGAELFKKAFQVTWWSRMQSIKCGCGIDPKNIQAKYLEG